MRHYQSPRDAHHLSQSDCTLNMNVESGYSSPKEKIELRPLLTGTVHPFHKSHTTLVGYFHEEFRGLFRARNVRLAILMMAANIFVYACLSGWSTSTNSLALRAYSLITLFDALALSTTILSAWVSRQEYKAKTNFVNTYTLGFERFEVLSVFSCVIIAQIAAVFIVKESLERISDQPEVHAGRLLPGALLALLFHFVLNYCVINHSFRNICEVASSSWIQEHVADMSKGICGMVPIFESLLVPRVNPFSLISCIAACGVLIVDLMLQIDSYYIVDTMVGLCIAIVTIGTIWPIAVCSGKVLLHSTPPYLLSQLDKILSEAQTLDGVLEIKCERFYTLKVGSRDSRGGKRNPALAGSLQVRVRRDADEQMVLAHVKSRFTGLVPILAIQVVKDDWTANPHTPPLSVNIPMKALHHGSSKHSPSSYISGFNKPAAAVAPYLQISSDGVTNTNLSRTSKEGAVTDFSFTSPASSGTTSTIIKPRSSQSDIARMYKAAGFKLPQSNFKPGKLNYSRFDVKSPLPTAK